MKKYFITYFIILGVVGGCIVQSYNKIVNWIILISTTIAYLLLLFLIKIVLPWFWDNFIKTKNIKKENERYKIDFEIREKEKPYLKNKPKELFTQDEIDQIYLNADKEVEKILQQRQLLDNKKQDESKYKLKQQTVTDSEKYFYSIIKKHFSQQYEIRPQVSLNSIIEKTKAFESQYQNELNRVIDFGIFDKESTAPLLLIEINDETHNQRRRKERDFKVKSICNNAGIDLIPFWTNKPNTEQYIVERIATHLNKKDSKK